MLFNLKLNHSGIPKKCAVTSKFLYIPTVLVKQLLFPHKYKPWKNALVLSFSGSPKMRIKHVQ